MTKNELKEYLTMGREVRQIGERLKELRLLRLSPSTSRMTGLPKGRRKGDFVVDRLFKVELLETQLRKKLDDLAERQAAVEQVIDRLAGVERLLMRYRYIEGLTWEQVSAKMNYERAHVHRLHAKILKKLKIQTQ